MSPPDAAAAGQSPGGRMKGARVATFEARMGSELANLVVRQGGVPLSVPIVREIALETSEPVRALIDGLRDGDVEVVICLTGVGIDTLFLGAEQMGRGDDLEAGLRRATTVCRGHKPRAALRKRDLPASVLVPEPFTTQEVIDTLATLDLRDRGSAIIHYGERSAQIGEALRASGSHVLDVCVYEWALPEDTGPAEEMIERIIAGGVDAAVFTSQVQVRHLVQIARERNRGADLVRALDEQVVVAAVGPTCAGALQLEGVRPEVVPAHPKMGSMIVSLADFLADAASPHDAPGGFRSDL